MDIACYQQVYSDSSDEEGNKIPVQIIIKRFFILIISEIKNRLGNCHL